MPTCQEWIKEGGISPESFNPRQWMTCLCLHSEKMHCFNSSGWACTCDSKSVLFCRPCMFYSHKSRDHFAANVLISRYRWPYIDNRIHRDSALQEFLYICLILCFLFLFSWHAGITCKNSCWTNIPHTRSVLILQFIWFTKWILLISCADHKDCGMLLLFSWDDRSSIIRTDWSQNCS